MRSSTATVEESADLLGSSSRRRPRGQGRSRFRRLGVAGAVTCLLSILVAASSHAAPTRSAATCSSTSLLGSWWVRVYFEKSPEPSVPAGFTEHTLMTFGPRGGLVQANPLNPSPGANSGSWTWRGGCTYDVKLVEFTYDTSTRGLARVLAVALVYELDRTTNHLHSTSATATFRAYDPASGQTVAFGSLPDVSDSWGDRFTEGWAAPPSLCPEPSPQPCR